MSPTAELRASILDAWSTNNRVTVFLVEQLPAELWSAALPGCPRRTLRMVLARISKALRHASDLHGTVLHVSGGMFFTNPARTE